MSCGNNSILGNPNGYIKYQGGDLVAIQGANVVEKLNLSNVIIPYKQIFKGSIQLKPGQVNYLINHFGIGDNATLVAMTATYNPKSRIEEDNYVVYNFVDDLSKNYAFAQVLTLTGNTINRIPHMYLTNPNTEYPVTIDMMIASIDDTYSFFPNDDNNSSVSFDNVNYTDIKTFTPGKTIYIADQDGKPRVYISLSNMESISRVESILIIKDTVIGKIYLDFGDAFSALQGLSIIEWSRNNELDIDLLEPLEDIEPPYVTFISDVVFLEPTYYNMVTDSIAHSEYYMELPIFDNIPLSKETILSNIVTDLYVAIDERDGELPYSEDDILLIDSNGGTIVEVTTIGTYIMRLNIVDIAGNTMFDKDLIINISNV